MIFRMYEACSSQREWVEMSRYFLCSGFIRLTLALHGAALYVMLGGCPVSIRRSNLVFAAGRPNWCNVLMQCVRRPRMTQFGRKEQDALTVQTFWSLPGNTGEGELLRWSDGVKDQETNVATWLCSGPQFQLSRSRYLQRLNGQPCGFRSELLHRVSSCFPFKQQCTWHGIWGDREVRIGLQMLTVWICMA